MSCCDTAKSHLAERCEDGAREALFQAVTCTLLHCTWWCCLTRAFSSLLPQLCFPQCQDQQAVNGQSPPCHRTPRAAPTQTLQHHKPWERDPAWHLCPRSLEKPKGACLSAACWALCTSLEIKMAETTESKKIKTSHENTDNSMQTK